MTFKIKDGVTVANVEVFDAAGVLKVKAPTADKWTAPITLSLSGDATGSASVDGNGNADIVVTLGTITLGTDTTGNFIASIGAGTPAAQTATSGLTITTAAGATSIAHADTSSVTNIAIDNSSTTVLQDISLTFDTFGHVTAASVASVDLSSVFLPIAGGTLTGALTLNADPSSALQAATKQYVDGVAQGLTAKPAVRAATTANLAATYSNGTAGVGSTLTATANGVFPTIDGVGSWQVGQGILVKDQTSAFQNGRYVVTTLGTVGTPWVLTRCTYCDEATEIPSMFVFVQEGTTYNSTGWVAAVDTLPITVGTSAVTFVQFSGAGAYVGGAGLTLTGNTFAVGAGSGITVNADDVALASTVAGDGLTFNTGVLAVGGTANRITVSADAVDIASTYVGQTSITTLGIITAGTWTGGVVGSTYGGTGVNNGTRTLTISTGNLAFTTAGAGSSLTLPATGTVATLAGTETLTNKTLTSPLIGTVLGADTSGGTLTLSSTSNATKGTITIGDSNAGTLTLRAATANLLLGTAATGGILRVAATTGLLSIDTGTYLTAESDTLQTVTARSAGAGKTTDVGIQLISGANLTLSSGTTASVSERKAITTTIAAGSAATVHTIDTWAKATYRMAKYLVTVTQGTFFQTSEITVFNDGTTTSQITEHSVFSSGADKTLEITFTADASGTDMLLRGTGKTGVATAITYKIDRTIIVV